eukprot:GDKJ01013160.1.p1 GENE.GDKJ01013160.1~~GDKJ01013160.1.p1  ORF type:complete len:113 (-),score=3.32 GDKJ01013160.1:151-489(-)
MSSNLPCPTTSEVCAHTNDQRLALKNWKGVALWTWEAQADVCAICRNHIMDLCIECQTNQSSSTSDDCCVSWGECKHAFHQHCISKWLKTRNVCPLDNKPWVSQGSAAAAKN